MSKKCTECGQELLPEWKFCPMCGEQVDSLQEKAESGDADAQDLYGRLFYFKKDYANALYWFKKAAEQNNSGAQFALGVCYEKGEGVEEDLTEAAKWYKLSAEQGNKRAQVNLGSLYLDGKGVNKDYQEAVKWLTLSADQNYGEAQYKLGLCYINGYGVKKDLTEAKRLFNLAESNGYIVAPTT